MSAEETHAVDMESQNSEEHEIQIKLDNLKDTLYDNIDKAIENGDNLKDLEVKAEETGQNANQFKRKGRSLKRKKCREFVRSQMMLYLIIIIVLALMGIGIWQICEKNKKN